MVIVVYDFVFFLLIVFFFFKQKTAYELRISDWSSDVCSSDLVSNNREIGVEVKRGPLDASATYFWSSSKEGQRLQAGPDGIFTILRERVEIEGLEFNVAVRMPIDGLTLSAGYAHLNGRYDSDDDGVVDTDLDGANISPDRLNLAASYARGALSARVQTQFYLSRRFDGRSEEHTSELQSLMRISSAVFCLKNKKINQQKCTIDT